MFLDIVEHGRQFSAFGDEPNGERVDAVSGIFLGEAFAFEHVAQVAAAVGADDLSAAPVRVLMTFHAARIFFIEAGPTAAGLEFGFSRVERVVATPADKRAT